jgi:uncharacterized Zn finger protein (UPF0148 family)
MLDAPIVARCPRCHSALIEYVARVECASCDFTEAIASPSAADPGDHTPRPECPSC